MTSPNRERHTESEREDEDGGDGFPNVTIMGSVLHARPPKSLLAIYPIPSSHFSRPVLALDSDAPEQKDTM